MGELGSIFDGVPAATGTKGPDLRVQVTVRRSQLERGESVVVEVPDEVPHGDLLVPRRRGSDDPPGGVRLHLSPRLGERTMLRLRGQGGEHPDSGRPGDLLVEVSVTPDPARRWWIVIALAVAAAGLGLGWLGFAGR
ncbi:MAG: hypothetical protein KC501_12205 [Myxococcales bacterium]|nr:hypothetical protein [Myxococcales bacterium]